MQKTSLESVKKTYNILAKTYNFVYGKVLENGRKVLGNSLIAEHNKKILEIGVGTGLMLKLYPPSSDITGIDISTEMLLRAQINIQALGLKNITLLTSNGEQTGLPDDSFDHPSSTPNRIFNSFALSNVNKIKHLA